MLDGGVEKAHKAVRANEPATSERAGGKEIFPDGKKVLDAGLKNFLTAKTKGRKQLLRAE